ncbi:MAG: lipopolysaccharide assembly protein LapA domain-containing protein [Pseudomonadota bacterium]
MARFLSWILGLPAAIVIILLAIANRQSVRFSLDPTSVEEPLLAFEVPLYLLLLAGVIIGIMIGGASSWITQAKWRKAARLARQEVSEVRTEAAELRRKTVQPETALLPGKT